MINTTAIATHLQASKVIEVREWAKVLWVKAIAGGRVICRLVSKKIGATQMEITRSKYAEIIAAYYKENGLAATVWDKSRDGGKIRVYIKDLSYSSSRARDQGFIEINFNGSVSECLKNNSKAGSLYQGWGEYQVIPYSAHAPRTTAGEVIEKFNQKPQRRGSTEKALDAMHGRGNWDRWDLEDYEG
jgi:hypothetical protein